MRVAGARIYYYYILYGEWVNVLPARARQGKSGFYFFLPSLRVHVCLSPLFHRFVHADDRLYTHTQTRQHTHARVRAHTQTHIGCLQTCAKHSSNNSVPLLYIVSIASPSPRKKLKNIIYRLFVFTYNKVGNVIEEKSGYRQSPKKMYPNRRKDMSIQNLWVGFFTFETTKRSVRSLSFRLRDSVDL